MAPQANPSKKRVGHVIGGKGSQNANAVLVEQQVLEIFHSTEPRYVIAEKYGVSLALVSMIRHGHRWAHLTGAHWALGESK